MQRGCIRYSAYSQIILCNGEALRVKCKERTITIYISIEDKTHVFFIPTIDVFDSGLHAVDYDGTEFYGFMKREK